MNSSLKARILRNRFADKIRGEMKFDEASYLELKHALVDLKQELQEVQVVDKDLVLCLYSTPLVVRNAFLALQARSGAEDPLSAQLEDAWVELDELVTGCLVG